MNRLHTLFKQPQLQQHIQDFSTHSNAQALAATVPVTNKNRIHMNSIVNAPISHNDGYRRMTRDEVHTVLARHRSGTYIIIRPDHATLTQFEGIIKTDTSIITIPFTAENGIYTLQDELCNGIICYDIPTIFIQYCIHHPEITIHGSEGHFIRNEIAPIRSQGGNYRKKNRYTRRKRRSMRKQHKKSNKN